MGIGHEGVGEDEGEWVEEIGGDAEGGAAAGDADFAEEGVEGDRAEGGHDDGGEAHDAESHTEDQGEEVAPCHLEDGRGGDDREYFEFALVVEDFDGAGIAPVVGRGDRGQRRDDERGGGKGDEDGDQGPVRTNARNGRETMGNSRVGRGLHAWCRCSVWVFRQVRRLHDL